jgi:endonuclease G, mitochondrial
MLVKNGTYLDPQTESKTVLELVHSFKREAINQVIQRTGRVEFSNVPNVPYIGTGWLIDERGDKTAIIITNRHVAKEFASANGRGGYRFNSLPNFRDYEVKINLLEEHDRDASLVAPVVRVVFIAGDNDPDIALVEAEGTRSRTSNLFRP